MPAIENDYSDGHRLPSHVSPSSNASFPFTPRRTSHMRLVQFLLPISLASFSLGLLIRSTVSLDKANIRSIGIEQRIIKLTEHGEEEIKKRLISSNDRFEQKKVIIAGEGRSGSTLVGTLFMAPDWQYYFEPLREAWPVMDTLKEQERVLAMNKGDENPEFKCSAHFPYHCTASNIAALLEIVQCSRTHHPFELLLKEFESQRDLDSSSVWVGTRGYEASTENSVNFTKNSGILELSGDFIAKPVVPSVCVDKKGVVAKTIRLTGRLDELYNMSEFLNVNLDLVIHLVRDPRAVLASRYSVGWGHPLDRTYNSTLDWSISTCNGMMKDASAGIGRTNYLLLRYEDLSEKAEIYAEAVWARIGEQLPESIRREVRLYNGCVSGTEDERKDCLNEMNKVHDAQKNTTDINHYDTAPRDFKRQIEKWRDFLSDAEIKAVHDGCKEMFQFIYPNANLTIQSKEKPSLN